MPHSALLSFLPGAADAKEIKGLFSGRLLLKHKKGKKGTIHSGLGRRSLSLPCPQTPLTHFIYLLLCALNLFSGQILCKIPLALDILLCRCLFFWGGWRNRQSFLTRLLLIHHGFPTIYPLLFSPPTKVQAKQWRPPPPQSGLRDGFPEFWEENPKLKVLELPP